MVWHPAKRLSSRLGVVPLFSSGIVERGKRERAWKSPHARKGDTPARSRFARFNIPEEKWGTTGSLPFFWHKYFGWFHQNTLLMHPYWGKVSIYYPTKFFRLKYAIGRYCIRSVRFPRLLYVVASLSLDTLCMCSKCFRSSLCCDNKKEQ